MAVLQAEQTSGYVLAEVDSGTNTGRVLCL